MHSHSAPLPTPSRPILKWAGGKFRLLSQLLPLLPAGSRLIEPFVGAGSVFLAVEFDSYVINDANPDLVALWTALQCRPREYIDRAQQLFVQENLSQNAYPHIVVTDKSYSPQVIENILWVRVALPRPHEPAPLPGAYEMWPVRLHRHLLNALAAPTHATEGKTLARFCAEYDAANSLPRGLALTCMKLLMWEHLVEFDLNAPAPETLSLSELTVHNLSASNTAKELSHA